MSRLLNRPPFAAVLASALLIACSVESPVAPTTEPEAEIPAEQTEPTPRAAQAVPDEYIVIFRQDRRLPPGLVQSLVGDHGLTIKHEYNHVLPGFAAKIPPQALAGLRNNPFIERIEPNLTYTLETPGVNSVPISVPEDGLRVRLVADDLAPGDVALWPNRGSEANAVQSTASRRPTYHAARPEFAGHASVGFNEGDDDDEIMEIGGVSTHPSGTLIVVFSPEANSASSSTVFAPYKSRWSRTNMPTSRNGLSSPMDYSTTTMGAWLRGTLTPTAGQSHIGVWRTDADALVDLQLDGAPAGSSTTAGGYPSFSRYLIGRAHPSSSERFDGQVAELLFYDHALPDCMLGQIVADLGGHYGVSVAPSSGGCAPPADPTGLSATAVGYDAIDLAWTDLSANESGFRVERRLGQDGAWEQIAETGPDVTTYESRSLIQQTEYCYRVAAFNGDGLSGFTDAACATTDGIQFPSPIDVPTSGLRVRLIANDLSGGAVDRWPNRGSDGDAVQATSSRQPTHNGPAAEFNGNSSVGFNEGGDDDEIMEIGGVSTHPSGTLIVVFSPEANSASSSTVFAPYASSGSRTNMPTSRNGLSSPMDYSTTTMGVWLRGTLTPTAGQSHIGVWRTDADALVDLQLDGAPAGSSTTAGGYPSFSRYLIGRAQPSSSERFDGQVAELLFYDHALPDCVLDQIVADLGGHYGVSVASTPGACALPADPTGLSATAVGHDAIDLAWTDASANENGFRVERRLGQDGAWEQIAETGPDVTTYESRSLIQQTEYCYRVAAFNGDGVSGFTDAACATTDGIQFPSPIDVPTSGLRVRLIANDLSGGAVDRWPNRGSDGDAVQATSSRQPTHNGPAAEFNGNSSVGFNEGGDDDEIMEIGGVSTHPSGTLIVVFSPEANSASSSTVFAPYASSGSRTNMPTSRNGLSSPMDYSTTTMGAWLRGTLTPTAGQSHIGVWRTDADALVDLQLDGAPAGSSTTAGGYPSFSRYLIGRAQPSSSERFDGQVAELLFYDHALPDCMLDQIVADLGGHYGVAVASSGGGCAPPADPAGLSATAVGYDAIDLAWTDASSNEDGFRIERRLGQDGTWEQVAETAADVATYESRSLIQQTEYCYRVSAFNGDGSSGFSNEACAVTETAPPGACVDTGGHDDLSDLYGIEAIGAPANQVWASTQAPGCEITPWYFGLDSGVDSDHPDLNVVEALSFVAAEPGHDGEDRNGHGTHTAGSAAARDGNGGVVGVAPGARIYSFRVCEDGGSCQTADMVAAMDEVVARKLDSPHQPMVANMSIGGPADNVIDEALRNSVNAGIVYAVAAGNGVFGGCVFPADAANVSPARVGDDEIMPNGKSKSDNLLLNGVLTTTSHDASFSDVNCNYGAPVSVAAPGYQIKSTWLDGGYKTISGTSMASPHAAGATLLYLQLHPDATPAEVEAAIVSRLQPWTTNESPNASGRLYVDGL